jgi:hypothetical protein
VKLNINLIDNDSINSAKLDSTHEIILYEVRMKKLEGLLLAIVVGGILPIIGLLAGWWGSYAWLPNSAIPWGALSGLAIGLVLDALFLRRLVGWFRVASWYLWAAVFLFYAVGLYGMFMGVPMANALLGLPAGFLVGQRLARRGKAEEAPVIAWRTAWFTSGVLAIACVASAWLALLDPYTAGNLEGMLGLNFTVTKGMIWGLILIGGAGLLAFNWFVTRWMTKMAVKPGN